MFNYKNRFRRENLDPEITDVSSWATVESSILSEDQEKRYKNLEGAIRDYFSNMPIKKICQEKKITRQGLIRLAKRCITIHPDGRIWGFRALIYNSRQKQYERTSKPHKARDFTHGGNSGELSRLFGKFPEIRDSVEDLFLKKTERGIVHEAKIPLKSIHKRFLDKCRQLGIKPDVYPFTTKNLGYAALRKHLKKLFSNNQQQATMARHGKDAARRLKSQIIHSLDNSEQIAVTRPFQRVEFDAHLIDAFCTITIPTIFGGYIEKVLERIWLLLIIDVYCRAVLGYYLCFEKQYCAEDVLMCIKNSITPWRARTLLIPGLKYHERGGFPSGINKACEWALWDELAYDNAKSNLAEQVREKLTSIVGCAVNAGPIRTPERRPFVERFFHTLEENGYHRLPSTTGSNTKDSIRDDPEKKALQYQISLEDLEELTDVMLANYNGEPHSGIGYRSPLELLSYYTNSDKILPRQVPKNQRNNLKLTDIKLTRIIRGKAEIGKRPHINYEGEKYSNDVLSRSPDLVGKRLTLVIDISDLRSITAFLPSGAELGILTAQGAWRRSPHSLRARKEILKLKTERLLHYTESDDPIQIYLDYLGEKSTKSKKSRGKLASTRRMQKISNQRRCEKDEQNNLFSQSVENGRSNKESDDGLKKELPRFKAFTY